MLSCFSSNCIFIPNIPSKSLVCMTQNSRRIVVHTKRCVVPVPKTELAN